MMRLGLLALWLLCAICALVSLAWMLAAALAGSSRAWTIALGYDRVGNATAGGGDGEYISSRCWRYRAEWPYRWLCRMIDWSAGLVGQADHCHSAFDGEILDALRRIRGGLAARKDGATGHGVASTLIRCGSCNRKLAEGEFSRLAIKCPRCGTLNLLKALSLSPERHRASIRKEPTDGNPKQQDAL